MSCGTNAYTTLALTRAAVSLGTSPLTADVVASAPLRLTESTRYSVQLTGAVQLDSTSETSRDVSVTLAVTRRGAEVPLESTQLTATVSASGVSKAITPALATELTSGDYLLTLTVASVGDANVTTTASLNALAVVKYVVV